MSSVSIKDTSEAKVLCQKLADVSVSKGKLKEAESVLSTMLVDKFEEKLDHDVTRDVKAGSIDQYAESLVKTLRLPTEEDQEQVLEKLKQMKSTDADGGKDTRMLEVCYGNNTWNSVYGVLVVMKNPRGNYNVAYALHKVRFKIAGHGKFLGIGSNKVQITPRDIDAIKTDYCRHKALTTMKEEGIIEQINYTE